MFGGQMSGRIERVFGRGGIRPQLLVRQVGRLQGGSHFHWLDLSAIVRVALPGAHKNPENIVYLGRAFPEGCQSTVTKDQDFSWDFTLDLDQKLVSDVEEHRRGNSIFLILETQVVGVEFKQDGTMGRVESDVIKSINGPACYYLVEKSRWLEILGELRYGDFYSADIALPRIHDHKVMERSLSRLQNAWAHFHDGRDREALAACYDALEALAKSLGYGKPDQNAYAGILSGIASEKQESLKLTFDYITKFMHLGRHEQKVPVEIDHRDAELAVVLVQASLSYLSRRDLKREKKGVRASS
jgi:hypothetical protein